MTRQIREREWPPPPPKSGVTESPAEAYSVSLVPLEWTAVLENLRRGVIQFEMSTDSPATGLLGLMSKIKDQIISAAKGENECREGWPQFVVMPENGFEEVHRGAADIEFQRNTAKHLAAKLGKPALVFIAVERWLPNGTMDQSAVSEVASDVLLAAEIVKVLAANDGTHPPGAAGA